MPVKKKTRRSRRSRKHGESISDYLPSVDIIASYVPYGSTVLRNYRDAKNLYDTGKKAFEIYQGVIYPKQPPLLPPGGPLTDQKSLLQSKRDAVFNKKVDQMMPDPTYNSKQMLEMMNAQRIKYPRETRK